MPRLSVLPTLLCAAALAACGQSTTVVATQAATDAALPLVLVHKSPACGCCEAWIDHMKEAEVAGYFVEGHVPAADVKRLLAERPAAKGLTVPGMPAGSPGMEVPDGTVQPYDVELVAEDGTTSVFSRHPST